MCMEDVRIGRASVYGDFTTAVPDVGNTPIVPQDYRRVALSLSVTGANAAIVAPANLDPSLGQGIRLTQDNSPLLLDLTHHGILVCQAWRASGDGAASVVTALFSRLEKE